MSKGSHRANPRKVPRTQADVDRARKRGQTEGINVILTVAAFALLEKLEADDDFIRRFSAAVSDVCDSMNRGYITFPDIVRALGDTHNYTVELRRTVAFPAEP